MYIIIFKPENSLADTQSLEIRNLLIHEKIQGYGIFEDRPGIWKDLLIIINDKTEADKVHSFLREKVAGTVEGIFKLQSCQEIEELSNQVKNITEVLKIILRRIEIPERFVGEPTITPINKKLKRMLFEKTVMADLDHNPSEDIEPPSSNNPYPAPTSIKKQIYDTIGGTII